MGVHADRAGGLELVCQEMQAQEELKPLKRLRDRIQVLWQIAVANAQAYHGEKESFTVTDLVAQLLQEIPKGP
jgi:hypothetical protein